MKRAREALPRLPLPRSSAFVALGPYAKAQLTVRALGQSLLLDVPADVFSTQRIDEGTLLLLEHLPARAPSSLLEVGCGYGALGLPICARFPSARALLLDRDLLAVHACAHNAAALQLANARVVPGLGYRDLPAEARGFDWVLCNVPARIGAAFIGHLLEAGRALLSPEGELCIVVIRDLEGPVEVEAAARGLAALVRTARGPRHSVYSLPAAPGLAVPPLDDEALYARDETTLQAAPGLALRLSRPHDASEDPDHLSGLSVLLDTLPRSAPKVALAFRCGYGGLPLALRTRHPEATVIAQERDLLDAAFTRRNARALGLEGPRLSVLEALWPADALARAGGAPPDLIVGELSPSAGPLVAALELKQVALGLAKGGQALVLATAKQEREWLPAALPKGAGASILLRRAGFTVLRLARPSGA